MRLAHYQRQDTPQTLAQGMEEYFALNPGLTKVSPDEPEAELFLPHDACHVFFGCGTSLIEEGMVDLWTLAGSDVGWRRYAGFTKYLAAIEPKALARKIGYATMALHLAAGAPALVRTWIRGKRMQRRWPWDGYAHHYDDSLAALRRHYGVEVLHVPAWMRRASVTAGSQSSLARAS
ncbi:MAG: hypothetical protein B7733_17030 [Myxococcales bacterium FL481]|nr:MAG: hypothetical protein B7733_17030 [Myxococcales bacterium FL481]